MLKSLWNWSTNVQCWGQQSFFKKGARDVEERKSNRLWSLATLGKYLLPWAREEQKELANFLRPNRLRFAPYVVDSCINTFDTAYNDKIN